MTAMIVDDLRKIISADVKLEHPEREEFGDYAFFAKDKALEYASRIQDPRSKIIEKVEAVSGFVNIALKPEYLLQADSKPNNLADQKIMVEFAHPNTHKEMHIGHMRTLITGEALARIFEYAGAKVFRANYQGDIGPHVAKSIWGTKKILAEAGQNLSDWEDKSDAQKAHLLGQGYVRGCADYEVNKEEIDKLNTALYSQDPEVEVDYQLTRQWSLDYYDGLYRRFNTRFDRLFFESEVSLPGREIVKKNLGKVFTESNGAIVFEAERYGLHTRVFVTSAGNPTYEGKEVALAQLQRQTFEFDKNIHVVANEQDGYFKVVIKAIELTDPWFADREYHLSMGMVNLVGRKISSRKGEVITVDGLLDEVKSLVRNNEDVALGAVKYSVLKNNPGVNVEFDPRQSVNVEGNSGPYLQYTYARIHSVLAKSKVQNSKPQINFKLNPEELAIIRYLYRFGETVGEAAVRYSPNLLCSYLYELAQRYNTFYNKHSILSADNDQQIQFRLFLSDGVASVLKQGLNLLGIKALERM